jgi:hypothetical protein
MNSLASFLAAAALLCPLVNAESLPPAGLVERLSSEKYPDRVAAEKELAEWAAQEGKGSWEWLLERSKEDGCPEIQDRALSVLKTRVLEDLSKKRPGFVGITMAPTELELEDGGYGVQIRMISPDSAAEKAGLLPNDIVTDLDGKGWDGIDAADSFAVRVGEMGPGTKVTLGVLRGKEKLKVDVVLGARPWSAGEYGEQKTLFMRQGAFIRPNGALNYFPESEEKAREENNGWNHRTRMFPLRAIRFDSSGGQVPFQLFGRHPKGVCDAFGQQSLVRWKVN